MLKSILILLLSISIHHTFAQQLTKADFIADLTYLQTTLPQKHTNLFSKVSQQDFNTKINDIIVKTDSLNYETFIAELFKLIVAIGDEHTRIEPTYTKVLPIKFELFKEGIYITGIDAEHKEMLLGKLIAINEHSMISIQALFKTVIQNENSSYFNVGLLNFLNNPNFLKGLKLIDSDNEATFTVQGFDGKEYSAKLTSVPKNENSNLILSDSYFSLLASKNNDSYWFQYDKEDKTLYFNYARCREDEQKPFDPFNNDLFDLITKEKPEKLILDLRNNSGGNSAILEPFIAKIKDSYLNKKGKFYTLIGKKTFSSALMNAVELKRTTSTILVGEPTSGNINHYGEVRGFRLPKTQIIVGYSTKYWETWKGKNGPLVPDQLIQYSIYNFKNGKDEAIEFIHKKK